MTTQALSNNSSNVFTYLFNPYTEGYTNLCEGIRGIDLERIDRPPLPWTKRAVKLLTGALFLILILNIIFYIFMRTFQNPVEEVALEPWADSEADLAVAPTPKAIAVEGNHPAVKSRFYLMAERHRQNGPETELLCAFHTHRTKRVVTRTTPHSAVESTYDLDWNLRSMKSHYPHLGVDTTLTVNRNTVTVEGTKRGGEPVNEVFELDPAIPLIMEEYPMQKFIKSADTEKFFCLIHPFDVTMIELKIKKIGEEFHPNFGRTIKTVTRLTSFLKKYFDAGEGWFNLNTGECVKMRVRESYSDWYSCERVPNSEQHI